MNEVIIRKATRDDCKAIRALIQELADYEQMSEGPKLDHETLERDGFQSDPPLFVCHVASCNEKIIGYAISYYAYSTWVGKAMHLEDLYVTPDYRRKLVGSRLFQAVAKEAVDNNCTRLDFSVLKWNPAKAFYTNKGAVDLTEEEALLHFRVSDDALIKLANDISFMAHE